MFVGRLHCKTPRRKFSAVHRAVESFKATAWNEAWAMDFVAGQLYDGRRIRVLDVVDTFTRECLCARSGFKLNSVDVIQALTKIVRERGKPKRIFCDKGSEFSGHKADLWVYTNKVKLAFSRPGKSTDNAYTVSFNGSFRDECLNCHWLESMQDAKAKIEDRLKDYNESRPHKALNKLSPLEFAAKQVV